MPALRILAAAALVCAATAFAPAPARSGAGLARAAAWRRAPAASAARGAAAPPTMRLDTWRSVDDARKLSVGEIKTEIYEAKKKLLDLRLLQKQKMMQGKIQAHEFKHEKRWVNLLFTALAEKEEAGEVAPSGAPGFEAAPESADA